MVAGKADPIQGVVVEGHEALLDLLPDLMTQSPSDCLELCPRPNRLPRSDIIILDCSLVKRSLRNQIKYSTKLISPRLFNDQFLDSGGNSLVKMYDILLISAKVPGAKPTDIFLRPAGL